MVARFKTDSFYGHEDMFSGDQLSQQFSKNLLKLEGYDINGIRSSSNVLVTIVGNFELSVFPNFLHHYKKHKWLSKRILLIL